ncbi:MAG: hypothetical protein RL160_2013 [Bacteroidota bacterium]|jgi:two-component system LytT family response regulator
MKAIIIDDETKSREVLRVLLQMVCPDVVVVGEAADIRSGINLIAQTQPELVFLDISLKDGDSFQLLEHLPELSFKTIFITAYDEYSVRALQFAGVPCLHKPVDTSELSDAVKFLRKQSLGNSVAAVLEALWMLKHRFEALPVLLQGQQEILKLKDLLYVEAVFPGCLCYTTDGQMYRQDKQFDAYAQLLAPLGFLCTKKFCVNRQFLMASQEDRLILSGGKTLLLNTDKQ